MKQLLVLVLLVVSVARAEAMGRIREILTNLPPVVVTNAPPAVTNAPPAVTNTPPVVPSLPPPASRWVVDEVGRWPLPWKVMGVHPLANMDLLVSRYDREGRMDSRIERKSGGTWSTVWDGDEETIGAKVRPEAATVVGDDLYFAAERGSTFLIYNQTSGKVRRGAKVPSGYKWNVFTTSWKGVPVVGGDGPDVKAAVFDMRDGKKLFQSPLDGLIAGMAEDDQGVLWLAVSDGEKGVANDLRWTSRDVKPSSVVFFPGVGVLVGSQVDGRVYRWTGTRWDEVVNLDCSKINRLAVDPKRGLLLMAGAKPDTFAVMDRAYQVATVARFTDEKKDSTGEQFDCDIKVAPITQDLILARAAANGCYVYTARTAYDQTPGPASNPVPAEAISVDQVKWYKRDLSGYKLRANLTASIKGGRIYFELDEPLFGDDLYAVSIQERDGKLAGGPFDGLGADGLKQSFAKSLTNMGGKSNAKGGPYWAGTDAGMRAKFRPVQGERLWVMVVDVSGRARSTVADVVWKE